MEWKDKYVHLTFGLLMNKHLTHSEKILYALVQGFPTGTCYMSNEQIAQLLCVSVRGVQKVVTKLKKKGLLSSQGVYTNEGQKGRILTIKKDLT